jgi:hypothetical protein
MLARAMAAVAAVSTVGGIYLLGGFTGVKHAAD